MRVFLAGEGKTELGEWANHPSYRRDPPEPGLLEALLRRVRPDGWSVSDAVRWKDIRKYQAHRPCPAEVRNVMGAVLRAKDAGCDILVFSRDRDRKRQREKDVAEGIGRSKREIPGCPAIVGGMAIEAIESWLASMQGRLHAESESDPHSLFPGADLGAMRAIVEAADLSRLPPEARSLHAWLTCANEILRATRNVP